jgi:hypothetical protein
LAAVTTAFSTYLIGLRISLLLLVCWPLTYFQALAAFSPRIEVQYFVVAVRFHSDLAPNHLSFESGLSPTRSLLFPCTASR